MKIYIFQKQNLRRCVEISLKFTANFIFAKHRPKDRTFYFLQIVSLNPAAGRPAPDLLHLSRVERLVVLDLSRSFPPASQAR